MNLTLNPEQFLAVYNCINTAMSPPAQEVKSKMDLILLNVLSSIDDSKNQAKFDSWMKQEAAKVESLKTDLKMINSTIVDDGLPYPFNREQESKK